MNCTICEMILLNFIIPDFLKSHFASLKSSFFLSFTSLAITVTC